MSDSPLRQDPEPDRPCLGGCGQLLMAAAWDAAHGHCPACWDRVRAPRGLHQEAEEAAARIGILRHDGRYRDFSAGYVAAAEPRDQRINQLEEAADIVLEADDALMTFRQGAWLTAISILRHARGSEADPDVADTAWAIIAHHRQHRTAG